MVTLRDAGLEKVRTGETSFDEILKKTNLTKEALPAYLINPDIERYEDKDVIIREGNKDNDFFKLLQGGLYVVKGGKKIAEIVQPGDYFGEMSAFTGELRSASIISKGRSSVKRYPGEKLVEIIEKYPDIAKPLFEVLATRLGNTAVVYDTVSERSNAYRCTRYSSLLLYTSFRFPRCFAGT